MTEAKKGLDDWIDHKAAVIKYGLDRDPHKGLELPPFDAVMMRGTPCIRESKIRSALLTKIDKRWFSKKDSTRLSLREGKKIPFIDENDDQTAQSQSVNMSSVFVPMIWTKEGKTLYLHRTKNSYILSSDTFGPVYNHSRAVKLCREFGYPFSMMKTPDHKVVGVVKQHDKQPICQACCVAGDGYKLCSGCKAIFYCSPQCQKEDWPRHKPMCKNKKKGKGKPKKEQVKSEEPKKTSSSALDDVD